MEAVSVEGVHPAISTRVAEAKSAFADAMMQDLNTAAALGAMFDLVGDLNSALDAGQLGKGDLPVIRDAFDQFDRVLGVLSLRRKEDDQPPMPIEEINRLIEERQTAKRRRDFAAADRIRADLAERGVLLEDSPQGTRWKRK
jgi:cysteinyl-tRNA synthetase